MEIALKLSLLWHTDRHHQYRRSLGPPLCIEFDADIRRARLKPHKHPRNRAMRPFF